MFIFQKLIDRSSLRQGFQIPVEYRHMLDAMPGGIPVHGETRNISVVIDGQTFSAQLKNQGFDQNKYSDHVDVIQIRYGENSPLAKYLRSVFHSTWEYVEAIKQLDANKGRKFVIKIPQDLQEYLAISATEMKNIFVAECITVEQKSVVQDDIKQMDELDFETFNSKTDESASVKEMTKVQKVRHLDRSIGDSLKKLYGYRCQMTMEKIGEEHSAFVVEAHHIVPFTKSMNNDSSNIIIISPNYHRIIHSANPEWLPDKLAFKFPNGLVEKVKINKHLKAYSD